MIRHSGTEKRNRDVRNWSRRYAKRSNTEFFGDALAALRDTAPGEGLMTIGLVGQRDIPGVALRRAQATLRWDLRPSLWSHAFLIASSVPGTTSPKAIERVPLREVTIHSRAGVFPDPADNAVTDGMLGFYADPGIDANVALVTVEMSDEELAGVARRATTDVNLDRLRYNLWETLGVWETYLWSGGAAPNPLNEGYPIFASAFIEYCFEAIPLDLAPGTSERNSAPEHLWNAAVWWYQAFKELEHRISGYCVVRDKYAKLLDPKELKAETEKVARAV
jgi:hypothetical protein